MIEVDLSAPNGRCEDCEEPKEEPQFRKCHECFDEWRQERYNEAVEDNRMWNGDWYE